LEKALCGGKNGNEFGSGLLKVASKRKKKVKKKVAPTAKKVVKSKLTMDRVSSRGGNDVESGEVCAVRWMKWKRVSWGPWGVSWRMKSLYWRS